MNDCTNINLPSNQCLVVTFIGKKLVIRYVSKYRGTTLYIAMLKLKLYMVMFKTYFHYREIATAF